MGSQWVEDPSWGNIFTGIANSMQAAPGEALSNIAKAEQIKAARVDAARKQALWQMGIDAGNKYEQTLPTEVPQSHMDVLGPYVGPPGATQTDMPGIPKVGIDYTDPVKAAQFAKDRPFFASVGRGAAAGGKFNELPGLYASGQVGLGGVPEDTARQQQLQFLSTGKFEKPTVDNYIAVDQGGNVVKRWSSGDGGNTSITGENIKTSAPPGTSVVKAGAADINQLPVNPFKDKGSTLMIDNAAKAVQSGANLSQAQAMTVANALADAGYSPKNVETTDAQGNKIVMHGFMEKEIPPQLQPLVRHINERLFPALPPSTPSQPPSADTAPPAMTTGAVTPPAQPAQAQAPQSIVPPVTTEVLSRAKSTAEQTKEIRAVAQASSARQTLEQLMMYDPTTGLPRAKPYVPALIPALINERGGGGVLGRFALSKVDPSAKTYYIAAKQWVEPVLRMASGAAIRDTEYADYYGMFIPEAGDNTAQIQQKLSAMKLWENATANAATSGEALSMMERAAAGNPMIRPAVERIRVRAAQAGTLDTPLQPLRDTPAQSTTQPAAPATTAPPGVDHSEVKRILGMQ
jgi:hypothetical protein